MRVSASSTNAFVPRNNFLLLLQIKYKDKTTTIIELLLKYFLQDQGLESIEVVPNLNKCKKKKKLSFLPFPFSYVIL
jgi:hypothetical protein